MTRVSCPICFKYYEDYALSRHVIRIHKDKIMAAHSADNMSSEIPQDSEDQSGYHDHEWNDMGEPMQEIEISENITPDITIGILPSHLL